jgi:hypothetical protein
MLTIKDHTLVIDGSQIQLPRLPRPATVAAWRVPAEYRTDGVFVSVTPIGEIAEVPACDMSLSQFLGDADLDAHPDALLDERKAAKRRQIEAERDSACVQPVHALGRTWQADKRSQELFSSAITIAQAGGPLPAVWRDAENNDMPVTSLADLLAIAGAIAQQTQAAYSDSWARKAAVDAATTFDEVDAA